MTLKEFKTNLDKLPDDLQVFIACDEELNIIYSKPTVSIIELEKSNNNGTFDALVIYGLSGSERN